MQHVAVIGAGIVGLATAAALQREGHRVTLVDPRAPGEYCSYGNAGCLSRASCVPLALPGLWKKVPGWLADPRGPLTIRVPHLPSLMPWLWRFQRAASPTRVEAIANALHALLDGTLEHWRPLAAWAGVPELIRQEGYAFAYASAREFEADALGRAIRRRHGVAIDVLEGPAIREFDPALSPRLSHLVVLPQQGHCPNPLRLSQALAGRLRAGGATLTQASARAFEVVAGRVARVVVDDGALAVDAVVVAAGVHANGLSSQLGSRVPLTSERGYHVMLEAPGAAPRIPVMSGAGKYFLTSMEGGLRVAGAVELASVDAAPDWRRADVLLAGAHALIPALTHGAVGRWMGHRPSLPDSLPVIARSPRFANAYFAFGHGHVGLTGAAPTAMLIADLVAGRAPAIDLGPYAIDRF
ncbi:MAG TPA: FAD-dependent oxidoreductase [Casimicrobiaceae bacterium]|jgi:D-amino-acid dehydrogenase|nr:FAD-dependent oxidoreductase [Casimicrobiaceae bacterium]